jgi:hypothetical protein
LSGTIDLTAYRSVSYLTHRGFSKIMWCCGAPNK